MSDSLGQPPVIVQTPDDLKLINGIGPKIEDRLMNAGITTYEQLANQSPEDLVIVLGDLIGISIEKIIKQNWIGQARVMAENAKRELQSKDFEGENEHLHYASFKVELLLDNKNSTRRTRINHIQSVSDDTWAGWDKERLLEFIIQHTGLQVSGKELTPTGSPAENPEAVEQSEEKNLISETGPIINLLEIMPVPEGYDRPYRSIPKDCVVNFGLKLEFACLQGLINQQIPYAATVNLRELDSDKHQIAGTAQGILTPEKSSTIQVRSGEIPEGRYRLSAVVELNLEKSKATVSPNLKVQFDGGLLQVY